MLKYDEALERILHHSFLLKPKAIHLRDSLGLVVSKDLFAPEPFPSFDNSAVDGYALALPFPEKSGVKGGFAIRGEVAAGQLFRGTLKPGQAVQVFTGAPIPRGTEAVVMQEQTERIDGRVLVLKPPRPLENIRFRGEDFQKGRVLVRKNAVLGPVQLALLAAVGFKKVPVHPSPRVAILATGSELLKAGEKRKPGKIWDSNTILLETLVEETGSIPVPLAPVGDHPGAIRRRIQRGLKSDIFIISGGVSVGKYDFVREVLKREGVREIFWKVDIKPGKPLFFGRKGRTLVFGLPGNPVSVFVTFEEFVKPAILKMKGRRKPGKWVQARLTEGFRNGNRLHFVRTHCVSEKSGYAVTPLKGQGSHMIGTLASSNALLRIEPNAILKRNHQVSVKMIRED